jgi:sodium transport system permease protein
MLRDRKALFFMFVLPVALYPLIMWGSSAVQDKRTQADADKVLAIAAAPALDAWLQPEDKLERTEGRLAPTGETVILAELTLAEGENPATIQYRSDIPLSQTASKRLRAVLEREQARLRAERFDAAGLGLRPDGLVRVEIRDAATAAERAGLTIGKLIPLVLVFLAMGGGLHTALDLFTGERERGTLETLLTSRVSRGAVVGAKFLLVLISTVLTSILALGSLGLCLHLGWFPIPGGDASGLTLGALLWAAALAVPLVVQLSSALVLLAVSVPDFKAGQFVAVPAMLLAVLPAVVSLVPGVSLSPLLALIPITNVALTTQEVMVSSPRWGLIGLAIGISLVHTGVILWLGVRAMGKESAVFGHAGRAAHHARGRYGFEAAGLFVLVLLLFWFVGQSAMSWDLTWGIVVTQILLIGLPALLVIRWLGLPLGDRLQLRRPAGADLVLGLIAGVLAPCLGDLVFQAQDSLIPISADTLELLEQSLPLDLPLWALIGLIAILPAVCEEVLFRGAILGLLRNTLGPVARCIVVAVLFGALHLMLMRILPTAALGLLLTAAAMRTRSLWVPVLMHLLNNGLAITAATLGWGGPADLGVGLQCLGACLAIAAVVGMGRARR